jgi:hypothetical protein
MSRGRGIHSRHKRPAGHAHGRRRLTQSIRRRPLQLVVALFVVAGGLTSAFIPASSAESSCSPGHQYRYATQETLEWGYGHCLPLIRHHDEKGEDRQSQRPPRI